MSSNQSGNPHQTPSLYTATVRFLPCAIIEDLYGWQVELVISLARHDLGDGMSDSNASLLHVLLGQGRSNANFDGWLNGPRTILETGVSSNRRALETSNQDPVRESLFCPCQHAYPPPRN